MQPLFRPAGRRAVTPGPGADSLPTPRPEYQSPPAEQPGGVLNEEDGLKALRERLTAVIVEGGRYNTLDPKLFPPATRAAMLITSCEEAQRKIDAAQPDQRVAVAKKLLDEYTELLAHRKKLYGREFRSLLFTAAWKLPFLIVAWLFALLLVGAAIVSIVQTLRGNP